MKSNVEHQLIREIEIQAHLRFVKWLEKMFQVDIFSHPNILRMYNYFHDEKKIILILEYALGGELFKELQRKKRFDEPTSAKVRGEKNRFFSFNFLRTILFFSNFYF